MKRYEVLETQSDFGRVSTAAELRNTWVFEILDENCSELEQQTGHEILYKSPT